ncbi:MAG: hypothetical protein ACKVOP_05655 [Sphingomonadaceae bacterium]
MAKVRVTGVPAARVGIVTRIYVRGGATVEAIDMGNGKFDLIVTTPDVQAHADLPGRVPAT